jgi:hypothetical protein
MKNKSTEPIKIKGSCLCGRVQYEAIGPFTDFRYCVCERCRKATGSAFASHLFFPKEQLKWITGESEITLFIHKEAEDFPRAFCKHCGAMVPRLGRDPRNMVVPAGTLEVDPGMKPTKNIFWKYVAGWWVSPDDLPKFDERP